MDNIGRDETMDGARTRRTQRASNNTKATTTMRKALTKRGGVDATGGRDSPRSALNMPRSASFDSAGGDDEETKEKNTKEAYKSLVHWYSLMETIKKKEYIFSTYIKDRMGHYMEFILCMMKMEVTLQYF